ncbi:cytochrome C oxidase assembly protein [Phaeobacter sp. B1627]|uniref:cytochrome C oxidase assembly protein n=1 Tax=Phaeobacter sp. B1627 TaxID=2583809 RepID=UPI00091C38F5|nr:cytochrome C oxidase assembly protein [Phaeobacter sp. B1627]OIQ27431.1 MAG: cytochrome C oxidase assembly protein [Alphaproteobacteria bacterium MedPE-SWcel]TNJ42003.1 cytochrome C oxidase assembly protein [Phaeobacter sp. B1627]
MSLRKEHELHSRRKGRNLGVGLLLGAFVVLVLSLTMVKVTSSNFAWPEIDSGEQN